MVNSEILLLTAVISMNGVALYSAFLKTKNEIEELVELLQELNTLYSMANSTKRRKRKLNRRQLKGIRRNTYRSIK